MNILYNSFLGRNLHYCTRTALPCTYSSVPCFTIIDTLTQPHFFNCTPVVSDQAIWSVKTSSIQQLQQINKLSLYTESFVFLLQGVFILDERDDNYNK
jgi:hypothetical protein